MSALPSAGGGYGALHLVLPDVGACNGSSTTTVVVSSEFLAPNVGAAAAASSGATKRKRRPAGTPDPGAEVVALSPKTLMESDRYVCEICKQGFQRDQNLQMHRRRHKVPWKLLKRPSLDTNKRVYICPEMSCLHHDPAHALGDLVGIKKHYRRKHCTEKQWKCEKCAKGYAVQSDYKAHLKTCGTRGHCCDCGRVFSRVESFIEHQDSCSAVKHKASQSGGGSDKAKSSSALGHHLTDRNSTGSPSQSSDTTQAMPFGISDTGARSSADYTRVADEHSRRVSQESQAVAATPSPNTTAAPPMPAWLTDHSRRNELELLPSKSHNLIRSSTSSPHPDVSIPESKSALEPSRDLLSLQLSMGPYNGELTSVSPFIDVKPDYSSSIETASILQRQTSRAGPNASVPRGETIHFRRSHDLVHVTSDLGLTHTGKDHILEGSRYETDDAISLSGFLRQAVRRLGPDRSEDEGGNVGVNLGRQGSSSGHARKVHLERVNCGVTESMANHKFPCAAAESTSSYHDHEHVAANMHESGADAPQGPRMTLSRRGFTYSQLEPGMTRSAVSSREAFDDHNDGAENNLFDSSLKSLEADYRSQKHMAPRAEITIRAACDSQARKAEMDTAWSDLTRVRRSRDEARQECDEAERDIARAELFKREAREQLQFAAAERAYAESALEEAKRHIEISEAELARAKRLREHSQSELDKVGASLAAISPPRPAFCHSCKSALESTPHPPSQIKSVPTSTGSSTRSFPTPTAETVTPPDHCQAGASEMNLWSGDRPNLWPAGYRNISTSPLRMAIGDSSPLSASRPAQPDHHDHGNFNIITPKLDLDLN